MTDIKMKHKEEYGTNPEIYYSCPGKITLSGEHTEYNDGIIISAAVNLYCTVSVSKRDDNHVKIYSANLNERKKFSISNVKFKKEDRWANYIKGVIFYLLQNGSELSGMDITINSEIPVSIGLGSSSAMCLAAVCSIKKLYNLELSWLSLVESARFSESVFMGLYNGLDDTMTMFFNKKDSLLYFDASTLEYENLQISNSKTGFVLLNPGVNNGDLEIDYIDDREAIYDLASILSKGRNNHSLRNYRVSDIRGCLNVSERIKRKAIFIVEEIKRSTDEKKLIEEGDLKLLGRYFVRSHEGLRDLFEATCPEVDWLVKRGIETDGVFGGKASGENSSGLVLFVMDSSGVENFKMYLEDYDKIFGFKAEYIDIKICDGLSITNPELLS